MPGNNAIPTHNGAVIAVSKITKVVISLVTKAELGALFINYSGAILACHALKIMGLKNPPPTSLQTDNTIPLKIITNNTARKYLKYIDTKLPTGSVPAQHINSFATNDSQGTYT